MKRTPERMAWSILFAALFTCCGLAVGVPTAGLAFYNTSTVGAAVDVKLQAGILSAYSQFETANDASVVSLEGRALSEGSTVLTGPDTVGLLTIGANGTVSPLLTLQLYSDANLRVERARLPRFNASAAGDEFFFRLNGGRVQVLAQAPEDRRFKVQITSDHAVTQIGTPGVYSIEQTDGETRLTVTDGQAVFSTPDGGDFLNLFASQRTVATADGISDVLPPFRNLIRNGEFQSALERDWEVETRVDVGSTVSGTATIVGEGANAALVLQRLGSNLGWGRTGVTQAINEDVRGRQSVLLRADFQILQQEIPVCGGEGSECPFMVRLDYRDKSNTDRSWIQGFYANGTPAPNTLPDYIRSNPQGKHVSRRLGVPETFESENLIELLPDMQTIKSITLYAEGHNVQTQVNSLELLLQD